MAILLTVLSSMIVRGFRDAKAANPYKRWLGDDHGPLPSFGELKALPYLPSAMLLIKRDGFNWHRFDRYGVLGFVEILPSWTEGREALEAIVADPIRFPWAKGWAEDGNYTAVFVDYREAVDVVPSPFEIDRNGTMTVTLGDGRVAIGDPEKGLTFAECEPHQIGGHVEVGYSEPRLTISVPEGAVGMSALRTLMTATGMVLRKKWLEANCPKIPEVELRCIICGATHEDVTKEGGQMFAGHVAVCSGCIDFCNSRKGAK